MIQTQQHLTCRDNLTLIPRQDEKTDCSLSQPQTNLEITEAEQQCKDSHVTSSHHYVCAAEDELCEKGVLCDGLGVQFTAMKRDGSCIINSLSNSMSISELSSSQHDSIVTAINMYATSVQADGNDDQEQLVSRSRSQRTSCLVETVNGQCCSDINHSSLNCIELFDESALLGQADGKLSTVQKFR